MTISHHKPNHYIAKLVRSLGVIFVCACITMVFLYNRTVQSRQSALLLAKQVDLLKTENTKLKNDLYTLIDGRTLTISAERLGYIKDSNPQYLTFLADGSVRSDERVSLLRP